MTPKQKFAKKMAGQEIYSAEDFVSMLKLKAVSYDELEVGDMLVHEHGINIIAEIVKHDNCIEISDHTRAGIDVIPNKFLKTKVFIIPQEWVNYD